ncbi:MAG: N-formylglutamate amidohydrolase [Methylococcus sp.]
MADILLVTCEHGGNEIPWAYRRLFNRAEYQTWLYSHLGYDAGALTVAGEIAARFKAPLFASTTSRLLVDLNRSLGHPRLFSAATRSASAEVRDHIIEDHYRPFRTQVYERVRAIAEGGQRVVHLSCHSFTPELNGITRTADIGLLYDPARPDEAEFCTRWKAALRTRAPALRVRRNYPYAGKNDGHTAELRRWLPPRAYLGIELEINQRHVAEDDRRWVTFRETLIETLDMTLGAWP